ncbi:UNKNOWN [Stylonychia lemnae]|uniref:Uncharacterized protein n=1 Tax=Stylonychia lemnae TaxID=5949 RepID=A0A077ZZW4_STYLE|nr:UNKNOWN [Stylonychia lemnae]|eukprot:CDW75476.1 UNKNOWN [Stylonychia lemnae]
MKDQNYSTLNQIRFIKTPKQIKKTGYISQAHSGAETTKSTQYYQQQQWYYWWGHYSQQSSQQLHWKQQQSFVEQKLKLELKGQLNNNDGVMFDLNCLSFSNQQNQSTMYKSSFARKSNKGHQNHNNKADWQNNKIIHHSTTRKNQLRQQQYQQQEQSLLESLKQRQSMIKRMQEMSRDRNIVHKTADNDNKSILRKKSIEKSEMFKVIKDLFNNSNLQPKAFSGSPQKSTNSSQSLMPNTQKDNQQLQRVPIFENQILNEYTQKQQGQFKFSNFDSTNLQDYDCYSNKDQSQDRPIQKNSSVNNIEPPNRYKLKIMIMKKPQMIFTPPLKFSKNNNNHNSNNDKNKQETTCNDDDEFLQGNYDINQDLLQYFKPDRNSKTKQSDSQAKLKYGLNNTMVQRRPSSRGHMYMKKTNDSSGKNYYQGYQNMNSSYMDVMDVTEVRQKRVFSAQRSLQAPVTSNNFTSQYEYKLNVEQ